MSVVNLSSSSLVAESNLNEESACLLVKQLKSYAFENDIFQDINQDPSIESNIRRLLKKLSGPNMLESIVPFLLDFEPLFDSICQSPAKNHQYAYLL